MGSRSPLRSAGSVSSPGASPFLPRTFRRRDSACWPRINEHVGDGAIPRTRPVARVRHIFIGTGGIEVADDMQNGAFRQQRPISTARKPLNNEDLALQGSKA